MNPMIYIVYGTTGEYGDQVSWPVAAYLKKRSASNHVKRATKRAEAINAERLSRWSTPVTKNEHDPKMQMDYTGTRYYIEKVRLMDLPNSGEKQ